jgi:hypothetical protein
MSRKRSSAASSAQRWQTSLEEIPNVGPSLAKSLKRVGIRRPSELEGKDPYQLYDLLCERTGTHQDPCVLDVFISAVRYMEGEPARPWWHYTPERKQARPPNSTLVATRQRL